jgi:L-lactate dehydrogenase
MAASRKIVILGAGHVGSHCAASLALLGVCDEIVLVDPDEAKARSQAMDVADSVLFCPTAVSVRAGSYGDCHDADLVVVAAGVPRLPGQTRLDVMGGTIEALKGLCRDLKAADPQGIVITISNPADIVADFVRRHTGLPAARCFGTGTSLDTARARRTAAEVLGVDRRSVQLYALGEHGDSSMIPFSCLTVGGAPRTLSEAEQAYVLERTHLIGMDIIEGKGSTEFGIGNVLADMARAVLCDEKRILPASALLEGEYGQTAIHAGVPCILGKDGIEAVITLPLTEPEQAAFNASCDVIRSHIAIAETI